MSHYFRFCGNSSVQEIKELVLRYPDTIRPLYEIPVLLYKTVVPQFSEIIAHFFNVSVRNGAFSVVLKIPRIVPILYKWC